MASIDWKPMDTANLLSLLDGNHCQVKSMAGDKDDRN